MKIRVPHSALSFLMVFVCLLLNSSPLRSAAAQTVPGGATQGRQLQQGEGIKALPGRNKRWALVIGVDDYSESQITKLSGAANDARTLADALTKYAGFPADQVTLLASDQPAQLQPHRSTILRYLSNLRGTVPKDGLLLVSFAGHDIERGGRAFLLPSDALGVNDMALLEDTAISVDRIKESIRATGVGQVILILDACRSDPTAGRSGGDNLMTADFRKNFNFDLRNQEIQAFATLYATDVGERAYEYAVKKQGYFTWALVEGLRGAAANDQGQVTLQRLVDYLQLNVPKLVQRDLGSDKRQRPFAIIEGYRATDLVIAVSLAVGPGISEATKEQALWEAVKDSKDARDFKDYLAQYPHGAYVAAAQVKLRQVELQRDPDRNKTTELFSPGGVPPPSAVSSLGGAGNPTSSPAVAEDWHKLSPAGEAFSVLMPKESITESRRSTSHGWIVMRNVYRSQLGQRPFFTVVSASGINPNPSQTSEAEKLDWYVDAFRYWLPEAALGRGPAAELTLVGEQASNGNSGREYRVVLGELSGFARAYFTGGRFYVAVMLGTTKQDPLGVRFFDSFVLQAP